MLDKSSIVSEFVRLGKNVRIDPFCYLGYIPQNVKNSDRDVIIGNDAIIRSHTVIYCHNTIGNHFQTGHGVLIREHNMIGDEVSIGSHSVIEHHITIGNGVRIQGNTFIPEFTELQENCWIGPGVVFTNAKYPNSLHAKKHLVGPTISKNAIIGAGVIIMPGVVIGEAAFIGAGSIVTHDVPPGKVYLGNPAKYHKNRKDLIDHNGNFAYFF